MGTKNRLGWLYERDKVQKALSDVRTAKANVTTMQGIVTTSVISRSSSGILKKTGASQCISNLVRLRV